MAEFFTCPRNVGSRLIALHLVVFATSFPRAAIPQPSRFGEGGPTATCLPAAVVSVWGGARHCILLTSDGTVWDLGLNWAGKLGDGTVSIAPDFSNDRHTPIEVHGPGNVGYLTSIVAIMGGESHNFALKSDGTVWSWGWNGFGQLGDGTNTDRYTPAQVSGLNSVMALGGRGYHSLALRLDGTVWTWGFNFSGQLGDGTTTNSNLPVQVSGLGPASAVTGGYRYSLALMPDHTIRSWGGNNYGQLGNGSNAPSVSPVAVGGLSSVVQVSGGWEHAVALRSDGTVWTWGGNLKGQLGNGSTNDSNVPVRVTGLGNVIAVSGGDCHTAALKSDGTVWTWGCNDVGELGDGTNTESHLPVQVGGLNGIAAITARDYHNLAVKSDGSVWAWGSNSQGQLGDSTTTDRNSPVQMVLPLPTPSVQASQATTFCAGGSVMLTASIAPGAGINYLWSPGGETTQAISVAASGSYAVRVTVNGCARTSSATVVTVNPIPAAPSISGPSAVCANQPFTPTAGAGYSAYQWYKDGLTLGPGATMQTYSKPTATAADAGSYTVTGTLSGCTSLPSASLPLNVSPDTTSPLVMAPGSLTTQETVCE